MSEWSSWFCGATPLAPAPDPWREAAIAGLSLLVGVLLVLVFRSPDSSSSPQNTPPLERSKTVKLESHVGAGQLQQLLESRRSVMPKDYTGKSVPDSVIEGLLEAAPWAPNHGKTEPWRFVVFGGEAKQRLLDMTLRWYVEQPAKFWQENFLLPSTGEPEFADAAAFEEYYRGAALSKWNRASHLIVICARRQREVPGKRLFPEWEENAAVACAVHNMHLRATVAKVGAYWSSWYKHYASSPEIARDLGLDAKSGDRCLGVFVVGDVTADVMRSSRATRLPIDQIARWVP